MTLNEEETRQLALLRASLGDWCFADVKRAASKEVELPRLAFVGLAAWLDTVATLYSGMKRGRNAWTSFIAKSGYFPEEMRSEDGVRRLNDGLRNALLHEYGTREVVLTSGEEHRSEHWEPVPGTALRVLHLESLIDVCEEAFERFVAELERPESIELRRRVLPRVEGLLQPVSIPRAHSPALGASVSDPVTLVSITGGATAARAASATGPLDLGPSGG